MSDFTIYYAAYLNVCRWRSKNGLPSDSLFLGVLLDMHPTDEKGFYTYGTVDVSIEELWKRRNKEVPANLAGTTVKIVYDYDQDVRAAML